MTDDQATSGPLGEAGARLRANQQLVASAINWVDEWLPTEGPAHCRNEGNLDEYAFERADVLKVLRAALLSAPVVSGWQQRACEAIRKAIEDEDGLDGLEGEQLLREVGYYSKVSAPVVTQEGEEPCP
jgi:hypothetical protein